MDPRPDDAVVFGIVPCVIGGETRMLRTRKIRAAREWKTKLASRLGGQIAEFNVPGEGGADSVGAIAALGALGSDMIPDLVVEYDEHGDLGGREHLEEHADDREVYNVLRALLDVHFPFVRDLMGAMRELSRLMGEDGLAPRAVETSPPESSPSGPSPIGADGGPTTSKRASTKVS